MIDVYICKLRKKIAAAATSGSQYIETVHGRGYKLSAPDEFDLPMSEQQAGPNADRWKRVPDDVDQRKFNNDSCDRRAVTL